MPSPQHPTAANTDAPFLRFPPFPSVPDGKTIVPFKDFTPLGIRRRTGEDVNDDTVECDGLGVPTVALTVKHSTDGLSKHPSPKNASDPTQPPKRKTWWEQWEELEDTRRHYYNPFVSLFVFLPARECKARYALQERYSRRSPL